MIRLLVVRHGQTDWNADERLQGSTDVELNAAGVEQARETAKRLSGFAVDAVVSSPMKRAYATAVILAEAVRCDVAVMDDFAERSVGIFEGMTMEEAKARYPELWTKVPTRQIHQGPPGGESILDVGCRVACGLRRIREAYSGKTVLLVTHGYVSRAVYGILTRPSDEEYFKFRMENGQVAEYAME